MSTQTPLLELSGIHAAYDRIEVLFDVNLVVNEGSVVALLGPNGAGKTTLLKVACGLMSPISGDVLYAGKRVNGTRPVELARRGISIVPEGRGGRSERCEGQGGVKGWGFGAEVFADKVKVTNSGG